MTTTKTLRTKRTSSRQKVAKTIGIGTEPKRKVATRATGKTVYHRTDGGSHYGGLPRPHFSGMTVAALAAAGFIRLTPNCSSATNLGAGDLDKFGKVVGQKAKDYWKHNFVDGKRLNKMGMSNVESRLKGQGAYKTTAEIVKLFYEAIRKGGDVTVGKSKYHFDAAK